MKTKHVIEDARLIALLNERYGTAIDRLTFIPVGDAAYSYRADGAEGERYYLKLFDRDNGRQREGAEKLRTVLPFIWQLYHGGAFRRLTSPIRTRAGAFSAELGRLTAALFTFVEGSTLADAYPMPDGMLGRIGAIAAELHGTPPAAAGGQRLEAERFDVPFVRTLIDCLNALDAHGGGSVSLPLLSDAIRKDEVSQGDAGDEGDASNPGNAANAMDPSNRREAADALAKLVLPRKREIGSLAQSLQTLAAEAETCGAERVVCHGDLWGGNLMRTPADELILLDWENASLAPRERDLFGYLGGGFEAFAAGYRARTGRPLRLRPALLRFYVYRHHLRNLTEWMLNILVRNKDEAQQANDLEMIADHCLGRWDGAEEAIARAVEAG